MNFIKQIKIRGKFFVYAMLTTNKGFLGSVLKTALPLIFNNTVNYLITLTDNIFVGKLGDAAAGIAFCGMQISSVFIMLISGIEGGILIGAAQSRGDGKEREARSIFAIGSAIALSLGVLITVSALLFPRLLIAPFLKDADADSAARYLRLLSSSFIPSAISVTLGAYLKAEEAAGGCFFASLGALAVNFFLGRALIFGDLSFSPLGINGGAIAFSSGKITEAVILLLFVINLIIKHGKKPYLGKLSLLLFKNFISYSTPLVLGQIVWIINTLFALFTVSGLNGGPELCAFSMVNTIGAATYILPNALSTSLGVFISREVGRGERASLKKYTYISEISFIALGALTSLLLIALREPFVSIYNVSPEAKTLAIRLIGILAVTVPATVFSNSLLCAIVKSGGDVSFILKNDAFFIFLVLIPLTRILLRIDAPVPFIFLALKSDQILKCIPAAFRINRFRWARAVNKSEME